MQPEVAVKSAFTIAPPGMVLAGIPEIEILRDVSAEGLKREINKRGIRFKDKATRLALAAAKRAVIEAGWSEGFGAQRDERAAVVVACCYGNAGTTIRCARQIADEGSLSLSPMDLPNASANVVAATLSIWLGFSGPSLLIANGVSSGFDALLVAGNLIRAGRADRVLVCGVESEEPALTPFFEGAGLGPLAPQDIAVALTLERASTAPGREILIGLPRGGAGASLWSSDGAGEWDVVSVDRAAAHRFARSHGAAGLLAFLSARQAANRTAYTRVIA